jgi:hypothetical protein
MHSVYIFLTVTTHSSREPRKDKRKLLCSTWKYSTTPRVLRLTLLTKASPGAYDPAFQNLLYNYL